MRGCGRSSVPPKTHAWSMKDMVSDLWEVADLSGADRVHLVGESMGGTIVLEAAIEQPRRVAEVSILNDKVKGEGVGELGRWKEQFATGDDCRWSRRRMGKGYGRGA